jgi:hypothetical protein
MYEPGGQMTDRGMKNCFMYLLNPSTGGWADRDFVQREATDGPYTWRDTRT